MTHPFTPDLLGDCTECPLPEDHPTHVPALTPIAAPAVHETPAIAAALSPDDTLATVIEWLRERVDEGVHCPACGQHAKVYRRKITTATARTLVLMLREAGTDWVHLPTLLGRSQADEAKARYWGLIEEQQGEREDGSNRVGWWRLTPLGVQFVRRQVRIPKYALIYDGRCLALDDAEAVSIDDALGTKFRYDDLMAGI